MTFRSKWRTARTRRWLQHCESVGSDPCLSGKPTINANGGRTRIGHRFRLASRPVASHLVAGPGALLEIGDDVSIGSGAAIAAYQHIRIGDGTQIGPFVILMDTNFHGSSGDQSIEHDCRPVSIGAGCMIGTRVTITRGVTIGAGAEILAGSVVSTDIPPGVCAAGARARIIGKAADPASRWDSAAARLPDVLMAALQLDSPPDLDRRTFRPEQWTDTKIHDVLAAIKERFGVALDPVVARNVDNFADLGTAVESALGVTPRQP